MGDFSSPPSAGGLVPRTERGKVLARDANSETLDNGDGTATAIIHPADVNVKDVNGNWQRIDDTLTFVDGRLRNPKGRIAVDFTATTGVDDLVVVSER